MDKTELLLRAKLSKSYKYREMLEVATSLLDLSDITSATLNKLHLPQDKIIGLTRLLFDPVLEQKVLHLRSVCQYISFFDSRFPQRLREIYRPPLLLFYEGDVNLLNGNGVAIVGARRSSNYSEQVLSQLIPGLVAQKKVIISGLAAGADSLAHRYTLQNQGATVAVIGCGLNHYYPKVNQGLQKQIMNDGLVVSEYLPDTPPARFRFPERNRIIAGLAKDVIVTEANSRSGSLITANVALAENRNVYAIPGPITSPLSKGTNELIAAGATPIIDFSLDNFD